MAATQGPQDHTSHFSTQWWSLSTTLQVLMAESHVGMVTYDSKWFPEVLPLEIVFVYFGMLSGQMYQCVTYIHFTCHPNHFFSYIHYRKLYQGSVTNNCIDQ